MNEDAKKNKGFAVLAYLSWLILIPIFLAKDSKFARFHVSQGFTVCVFHTIWILIECILGSVFGFLLGWIPVVGWLIDFILFLPNIFFMVFIILGIVNAFNEVEKPLPIFGRIHIL